MERPVSPGNITTHNNPQDFGFPGASISNNKMKRHGRSLNQTAMVSKGESKC
jgi:hypothetical protein